MEDQAQEAVRRFLLAARHHPLTGSDTALADRINARAGRPVVGRSAVGAWITGRNQPNASILFLIAADLGIGLDDFAFRQDRHPIKRELDKIDARLRDHQVLLARLILKARQEGWQIEEAP